MTIAQVRKTLSPIIRKAGIKATAAELGTSTTAVHRWIEGQSTLGTEKLEKLARICGYKLRQEITLERLDASN